MQTPPHRSGNLDIKDAQCTKKMMGVKYHITSRLGATGVQKGRFQSERSNYNPALVLINKIPRRFVCVHKYVGGSDRWF